MYCFTISFFKIYLVRVDTPIFFYIEAYGKYTNSSIFLNLIIDF